MKNKEEIYNILDCDSKRIMILRGILALMVVNIHAVNTEVHFLTGDVVWSSSIWIDSIEYLFSQIISRIAVPAFYFISAILLYKNEFVWSSNIRKQLKKNVIPYLLFNSIWIFIFYVLQLIPKLSAFFTMPEYLVQKWGMREWLHAYGLGAIPIVSPLWFLRDLFILNVFAKILKQIVSIKPNVIVTIVVLFWLSPFDIDILLVDKQAICFWVLGCYFVCTKRHICLVDTIHMNILAPIYFVLVICDLFTRAMNCNCLIHNFGVLVGLIFWFKVALRIFQMNNIITKLLGLLSTYSFNIYLLHQLSLNCINKVYARVCPTTPLFQIVGYVVNPCLIICACVVFSIIMKKYCNKLYNLLFGVVKS